MDSTSEASKEELIETIESLKEENSKTRDELMEKVRNLEGEQLMANVSNRQLEGKIKELKGEIPEGRPVRLYLNDRFAGMGRLTDGKMKFDAMLLE